ncbi:MAG: 50S ribosomal protein L6 [Deltaproteobacteria bacterium]|nr:50S ribosomal protein L6 [Deltaproteobacteria bacterium]
MSRIGKQAVELGVAKAHVVGQVISIDGPKGKLQRNVRPEISVELVGGKLVFSDVAKTNTSRAYHGLERALANNMVQGVTKGFQKELQLIGVGYKAEVSGNVLELELGFSHPVKLELPAGVKGSILKEGRDIFVKLEGVDRQQVGEVAARIRRIRPPEPYKGKGIRYRDEVVKLKAGKAGKK